MRHSEVEFFKTDHFSCAVFHQHDFVARFLRNMLLIWISKPNRECVADLVVENFHFGHIFVPSLIASVGYAVMRKPSSPDRLVTAQTQRFGPSVLYRIIALALPNFIWIL